MSDVNSAGVYLSRQLEMVIPTLFEKKYPALWAAEGKYHNAQANLGKSKTSIIERIIEQRGEALPLTEFNTDYPGVEVGISETSFKVQDFVTSVPYSLKELWASEETDTDIVGLKLRTAYDVMQERIHRNAVFGNPRYSQSGLFSNPSVSNVISPYNPNTATWQQHLDFFAQQLSDIADVNNNTANVGSILIPPKLRFKLASIYQNGDSGATVMQALMDNFGTQSGGFLTGIFPCNECRASELEREGVNIAGSNLDRVVFIPEDLKFASRHFYPVFTSEPQLRDMHYRIFLIQGSSEMVIHYPKEIRYVSFTRVI